MTLLHAAVGQLNVFSFLSYCYKNSGGSNGDAKTFAFRTHFSALFIKIDQHVYTMENWLLLNRIIDWILLDYRQLSNVT